MKTIDLRSALVGVVLGVAITCTVAATTDKPTPAGPLGPGPGPAAARGPVEYRVLTASIFQDELGKMITAAVGEGWEFVSASGPGGANWAMAVVRRERR